MEIKDNTFSRQFETILDGKLISLEYSFQEKTIFLTKIKTPQNFDNEFFIKYLIKLKINVYGSIEIHSGAR